jgi:hypothetical protein
MEEVGTVTEAIIINKVNAIRTGILYLSLMYGFNWIKLGII